MHRFAFKVAPARLAQRRNTFFAAFIVCFVLTIKAPSQTFTNLITFDGTDGEFPAASLIQGIDGNFYGTTLKGGAYNGGTVFKITPGGKFATLYSFCANPGANCPDGSNPGGLVLATNGMFYGTTQYGGTTGVGAGTIFQITSAGDLKTLYSFCSQANCADGEEPGGPLLLGENGKLYGTTPLSGSNGYPTSVIFEITTAGAFEVLNTAPTDTFLNGPLIQANNGDFYTSGGNFSNYIDGAIFKITPSGALSAIFAFNDADGYGPNGALLQGPNADLYGTTGEGGASTLGKVFQLTLGGAENVIYSFTGGADGGNPTTGVLLGTDGNFYGTSAGGTGSFCPENCGIIFQLTPGGNLTPLYEFCSQSNCSDGAQPNGLLQGTDGNFYGTTFGGPLGVDGTVFKISVGLGPFVKTLPTSGVVGEQVGILGNNLKGTTAVSFNGTAATFRVYSNTLILTTVPTGATTGTVEVKTPSGTLASNMAFLVR
jgi:uncharacterized repeat protein (TIGR03803 family)